MSNVIKGRNLKFMSCNLAEYQSNDQYRVGSVKEVTHDGDTIKVSDRGNFSVRFLGIDTPEISFEINNDNIFHSTGSPKWINYLNEISTKWCEMKDDLGTGLFNYVSEKLSKGSLAINHSIHAKRAENKLEELIESDMKKLGLNSDSMKFFLPFSYEILDQYGRLLSFVHVDKKNPVITTDIGHIESYNFRMLESGHSLPYFIWPNINPFRKESDIVRAVYDSPSDFRTKISDDLSLGRARDAVKKAREDEVGVFQRIVEYEGVETQNLLLEAFELRYLSRQKAPSRYFIDLCSSSNQIIKPTEYFKYLPEDRLFLPTQYIPLFEKKGWVVS